MGMTQQEVLQQHVENATLVSHLSINCNIKKLLMIK